MKTMFRLTLGCALLISLALKNAEAQTTCPLNINSVLAHIGAKPDSSVSAQDYAAYKIRIWNGHLELADQVWSSYIDGVNSSADSQEIESCLIPPLDHHTFTLALNEKFTEASLARIRAINPPEFFLLNSKYKFDNIIFRVFDPVFESNDSALNSLENKPAGFNDAGKALFASAQRIQSENWDITFLHELGHYIDHVDDDIQKFNDLDTMQAIATILQTKAVDTTTDVEKQLIDSWLKSGLNIGFLAEWRVWCFTVEYLSALPQPFTGAKYAWIKPLLNLTPQQIKVGVFDYLDPRFSDPRDGIFSNPIMGERLKQIRNDLRLNILNSRSIKL